MDKHVVVTYNATPEEQAIFLEVLGDEASITLLSELSGAQREQALQHALVLLSWNFPREILPEDYPSLRRTTCIQLVTAGVDHVPFAALPARVIVASNPGAYAAPMAEHVLAMTLALAKRLWLEHQHMKQGTFDGATPNRLLAGMTVGILGFGGVGRATARLMRAFGMRIYAINTSANSLEHADFLGTLQDLERVMSESDLVVITLPLTRDTRGLIGKEELAWMKPNAILVNVARGAILDEGALFTHLKGHPAFQVGIDTWWEEPLAGAPFHMEYPFLELPNVLGSPHNSAIVPQVLESAARAAAENVKCFLNGRAVRGIVLREDYL